MVRIEQRFLEPLKFFWAVNAAPLRGLRRCFETSGATKIDRRPPADTMTSAHGSSREAAVSPRLLIRRETPTYLAAAGLYNYPPHVDSVSCNYSSADLRPRYSLWSNEYKQTIHKRAQCTPIYTNVQSNDLDII